MTTEDGLLANVVANPADDLPRKALADYWRETGRVHRADFVQVQLELEACPKPNPPGAVGQLKAWQRRRLMELQGISDAMLHLYWREWAGDLARVVPPGGHVPSHIRFRRGFVHTVRCTLADWCGGECGCFTNEPDAGCESCHGTGYTTGIGPAVVRRHPIQRVEFTGGFYERMDVTEEVGVLNVRRDVAGPLWPLILDRIVGETRINASIVMVSDAAERVRAAVSGAAIAWAKSQVTAGG